MSRIVVEHERKAFETWMRDGNAGSLLSRLPNGDYSYSSTHRAWGAWQASRAALATPPAARDAITAATGGKP